MKLHTEEQVRKAIELARDTHREGKPYLEKEEYDYTIDEVIEKLTSIELPSDEEIEKQAHIQYPVNLQPNGRTLVGGKYDVDINYSERNAYLDGAKWMRDKIQGGNK